MNGTLAPSRTQVTDDAASDAGRWGIPLERLRRQNDGVWLMNVPAVTAFQRIGSLFRTPGAFGGVCGLDYSGVRDGLEMAGIEVTPSLWAEIQCIEAGAIEAALRKFK